ncbi:MAG: efflux RND transporter periplasmic adaptor subunit [Gammaproteobacteria bacterium]
MNRKVRILIVLVIVILVTGAIYRWYTIEKVSDTTALVLYGNVDIREVRLAFNGSEHVSEILVEEGDRVTSGQLLARLHTERLAAARERVQADVVAAKAEEHAAQLSFQRIKSLAGSKLASKEDEDVAEAKSRVASAQVTAAEAALAESDQALKDAELHAPESGIIRERIVEPGDFVTPQKPVLTLALMDPVWVRTYLPESYLGRIKPGAEAFITTDSYPDKVYKGWIGSISPTAEFTPKNVETPDLRTRLVYQMRVYACNPENELRLGMPATVTIPTDQDTLREYRPEGRCASSAMESQ